MGGISSITSAIVGKPDVEGKAISKLSDLEHRRLDCRWQLSTRFVLGYLFAGSMTGIAWAMIHTSKRANVLLICIGGPTIGLFITKQERHKHRQLKAEIRKIQAEISKL